MEDCSCPLEGWCARHKLNKSTHLHKLCQSRADYRQAWDDNRGPMQDGGSKARSKPYTHWEPLHAYPVTQAHNWDPRAAKVFYRKWEAAIPNKGGCACKANWEKLELSPDYSTAHAFFEWAWKAHDTVSEKITADGRQIRRYTLAECYAIWGMHTGDTVSPPPLF